MCGIAGIIGLDADYKPQRHKPQEAGHRFKSHSDTETIVHAYEEYGERFLDKLNGQFALSETFPVGNAAFAGNFYGQAHTRVHHRLLRSRTSGTS